MIRSLSRPLCIAVLLGLTGVSAFAQPFYTVLGHSESLDLEADKARRLPLLISIAPIPPRELLTGLTSYSVVCVSFVRFDDENGFHGVPGVKASLGAVLYLQNLDDDTVEIRDLGEKRLKTASDGSIDFDFDVPAELVLSQDSPWDLAWVTVTASFKGNKKVHGANLDCRGGT